jgi:predicted nucleotidyltransferase
LSGVRDKSERLKLGLAEADGARLLADLIADGYIDKEKLTPTQQGMALAQAEDRDRLPLSEAQDILNEFLDAVRRVNAKPEARVLVERVHVFGSYLAGAETVGDIDLLIEMPLPEDCEPEDMGEQDAVIDEIKISDYLSFHDEFDLVAAEAEKCLIYDRHNPNLR